MKKLHQSAALSLSVIYQAVCLHFT